MVGGGGEGGSQICQECRKVECLNKEQESMLANILFNGSQKSENITKTEERRTS